MVSRGSELRLPGKRTLRFIPIPTPRWPDLVSIYSEEGERQLAAPLLFADGMPQQWGAQRQACLAAGKWRQLPADSRACAPSILGLTLPAGKSPKVTTARLSF